MHYPFVLSLSKHGSFGQGRCCLLHHYPPHPHRLGDVLDRLFTEILILQNQLILDVVMDSPGNANPARLCQALQPRRNVDPISIEPFILSHYIADVDANTKLHPAMSRKVSVPDLQLLLDCHRTLHGVHRTGKLGQVIIPLSLRACQLLTAPGLC